MATAIYLGFLLSANPKADKETIGFYANLVFVFATYDLLVLLALFQI